MTVFPYLSIPVLCSHCEHLCSEIAVLSDRLLVRLLFEGRRELIVQYGDAHNLGPGTPRWHAFIVGVDVQLNKRKINCEHSTIKLQSLY